MRHRSSKPEAIDINSTTAFAHPIQPGCPLAIVRLLDESRHPTHAEMVLSVGREMSDVSQHPNGDESPRFYSVPEAARILRVSEMTLYRSIAENGFPTVRVRSRLTVPARAIDGMKPLR